MKGLGLLSMALVAAVLIPLYPAAPQARSGRFEQAFPGWPESMDGLELKPVALTAREEQYAKGFPGRVGAFSNGRRQYIIRWVADTTRMLHPAADCFRGSGYNIQYLPLWRDANGREWSTFSATGKDRALYVREYIYDGAGNNWAEVSEWYWAATLGRTSGPWWVITSIEVTVE